MTRMAGPDCAIMCNLLKTHTHNILLVENTPITINSSRKKTSSDAARHARVDKRDVNTVL